MTSLTLQNAMVKMENDANNKITSWLVIFSASSAVSFSGRDFHMVCCCIKSNLTLLDQRLWGSGVYNMRFFASPSSSPASGRSWISQIGLFISFLTRMSSFRIKDGSRNLFCVYIRIHSPLTIDIDCECRNQSC